MRLPNGSRTGGARSAPSSRTGYARGRATSHSPVSKEPGNALPEERDPAGRRFAALVGSAATTVGLTDAMWVERITGPGRGNYERRIGLPITTPPGTRVATPAATYLPATFVTGVGLRPGA